MQRLFSMFPAGVAGIGLLILRLCAVGTILSPLFVPGTFTTTTLQHPLILAVAILLCIGLFTPITSVMVVLIQTAALGAQGSAATMDITLHILLAVSLLMLGPGAYSVDARLFGRRLIPPPPR